MADVLIPEVSLMTSTVTSHPHHTGNISQSSLNEEDSNQTDDEFLGNVADGIETYVFHILMTLGTIGNILCLAVLSRKGFR